MFTRDLSAKLKYFSSKLPVVAILGPRQSGKTTLAQMTFPDHHYISLEDIDQRLFATSDPRRFLRENENEHGLILDEIQHAPDLLSYITPQEICAHQDSLTGQCVKAYIAANQP